MKYPANLALPINLPLLLSRSSSVESMGTVADGLTRNTVPRIRARTYSYRHSRHLSCSDMMSLTGKAGCTRPPVRAESVDFQTGMLSHSSSRAMGRFLVNSMDGL